MGQAKYPLSRKKFQKFGTPAKGRVPRAKKQSDLVTPLGLCFWEVKEAKTNAKHGQQSIQKAKSLSKSASVRFLSQVRRGILDKVRGPGQSTGNLGKILVRAGREDDGEAKF